jgi:hypothetical protein
MRHFHLKRNPLWRPVINTDKLVSLVPKDQLSNDSELVPVIDLIQHGYAKVLAKGRVTGNRPLIVKARYVSKKAEEKIKVRCQLHTLSVADTPCRRPVASLSSQHETERGASCRTGYPSASISCCGLGRTLSRRTFRIACERRDS